MDLVGYAGTDSQQRTRVREVAIVEIALSLQWCYL
jgi:hypothetical protein